MLVSQVTPLMHYCNLDEDDVSIGGNDGKMIDEEESRGPMSLPTVATLATSQVCSSHQRRRIYSGI